MSRLRIIEIGIVMLVLSVVAGVSGGRVTDWFAAVAILIGFVHSALSLDAAEEITSTGGKESVSLWIRATFFLKESCWIVTFLLLGSYPLIAGAVLFITYPFWHSGLIKISELIHFEKTPKFLTALQALIQA